MDRLFTQDAYEEEQKHAHSILTIHVLHRGFNLGAPVGLAVWSALRVAGKRASMVKWTGLGALGTTAFMAVGVQQAMKGKTEYEWQERSWRLLSNKGQNDTDIASVSGGAVGALIATIKTPSISSPIVSTATRAFGGAALGSFIGSFGSMLIWHLSK